MEVDERDKGYHQKNGPLMTSDVIFLPKYKWNPSSLTTKTSADLIAAGCCECSRRSISTWPEEPNMLSHNQTTMVYTAPDIASHPVVKNPIVVKP